MDPVQVRRWIAGFDAIARADLEALRRRGPEPALAIALALSMIAAAEQAGLRADAAGPPRRDGEDEAVRAAWARLRERQGRGGP